MKYFQATALAGLLLFTVGSFCGFALAGGESAPVPPAEEVDKAEEMVKDLFKKEYASAKTKAAERALLAVKLLQQASQTKDDLAARYVLLREARDLAAKAGDAATAMRAADEMASLFQVPPGEVRAAVATSLTTSNMTTATARLAAEVLQAASDEAIPVEDWPSALTLLKSADLAAKKAQATALVTAIKAKVKRIETLQAEAEKIKSHLATLEKKADDTAANLAVGRYQALLKQDWEAGLPHLALGSDAKLQEAAQKDIAAAAGDAKDQLTAADAWYDVAGAAEAVVKPALQIRAFHWYNKALPELDGLNKTKAEKRVTELQTIANTSPEKARFWKEVRKVISENQMKRWQIIGGAFAQINQEEIPPDGGLLIGFRYTTVQNGQYPRMVQAIYQTARGESLGKVYGTPDKGASPVQQTKAKPGYAVGALYTRGGGGIDAIKPIYMRLGEKGLDPKDQYEGPYIGGNGGNEGTLGGDGNFIVGLRIRLHNDGRLHGVSLVSLTSELALPKSPKKKEKE